MGDENATPATALAWPAASERFHHPARIRTEAEAMIDPARRLFLRTCAAVAAAPALRALESSAAPGPSVLGKPVGLQLYSLREYLPKDVPGTLAKIRAMGFDEVEGGDTYGLGVEGFKAALAAAGLKQVSEHHGYAQWRDDTAGALKQATGLGARYAGCAWIPHEGAFTREDCLRAAADFNKWGKATKDAGLRFFYHVHGYEFQTSPEGTLFDTLMKETDPALVAVEADVFWVKRGGGDPVALFERYPGRIPLTHLKDIAKGVPTSSDGKAPDETCVPLGQGQIDWKAVLAAATKAGVERHFIEDEHPNALAQIPESLRYLATLRA
jgi:sugar phosphate isomerase/epimerase